MANSKIVLTWTDEPVADDIISFDIRITGGGGEQSLVETFKTPDPRWSSYHVPTRTTIGPAGEQSMLSWLNSFNIDWNSSSMFNINITSSTVVEISFLSGLEDWEFYNFSDTSGFVNEVITNNPLTPFTLVEELHQEASIPCQNVEISVETNVQATQYRDNGGSWQSVSSNPFTFDAIRGVEHNIEIEDAIGYSIYLDAFFYDYLTEKLVTVNITQTIVGATIQIIEPTIEGLDVEYSLDNVNWKSDNVFSGQAVGAGTAYLRDQFGCLISKAYEVTAYESTPTEPFLFLSKACSINYSFCEDWDGYTIFKNDQNTLAFQSLNNKNYCELLLFQTNDTPKTQFKSNFETVSAIVRDEDGNETAQSITKRTSNLARFEKMDCMLYLYKAGKMGIYFENGWTYDELGAQLEEYDLSGNLPDFAIIGVDIVIDSIGGFIVEDVIYDDVIKKRVIVVDYAYTGTDFVADKVATIYNLLPYEVYEFTIDWSLFGEGIYDVLITNEDTTMDTLYLLSENIWIQDEHAKTVGIRYYNRNNRDIFYKYGIEHFIRMPILTIEGKPRDKSDINVTDLVSNIIESSVHEINIFRFDAVTKEVMRKLVIALSCETVFINGIGYIKDGGIGTTNDPNTNLYEVEANMLKTNINYTTDYGNNYNNNEDGEQGADVSGKPQLTPSLLSYGTGFIKT